MISKVLGLARLDDDGYRKALLTSETSIKGDVLVVNPTEREFVSKEYPMVCPFEAVTGILASWNPPSILLSLPNELRGSGLTTRLVRIGDFSLNLTELAALMGVSVLQEVL